jgi:hypothetical protein
VTTEVYIPQSVICGGEPLGAAFALTLYDPDGETPHGALTTHTPLDEGFRGGPLVVEGTREERRWRVTLDEIEVVRKTAVGCEFSIYKGLERTPLAGD